MSVQKIGGSDFQAIYLGICRNAQYVRLGVELKEHNMSSLHRSPILHIIIIIIISYPFT
jgi:hypothetical protein